MTPVPLVGKKRNNWNSTSAYKYWLSVTQNRFGTTQLELACLQPNMELGYNRHNEHLVAQENQ